MQEKEIKDLIEKGRAFIRRGYDDNNYVDYQSDQDLKKKQPPLVKDPMSDERIVLPTDFNNLDYEMLLKYRDTIPQLNSTFQICRQ